MVNPLYNFHRGSHFICGLNLYLAHISPDCLSLSGEGLYFNPSEKVFDWELALIAYEK